MHPGPGDALELGLNTADPTTLVIDLNCAFASIEQQHDPGLRGRPLAIAAYATDAATIVSSSREARDLGIKTGMRVFEAKAIFPRIAILEPNPPRYRDVSDKLMEILERHSPDVLRMSIDEASLNLAGTPDLARLGPEGVGRSIKLAVREEVGECVTCSIDAKAQLRSTTRVVGAARLRRRSEAPASIVEQMFARLSRRRPRNVPGHPPNRARRR